MGRRTQEERSRHRLRDAAAGGIAGGILTAAALNHHDMKHTDSRSSIDRKERRRRRSKSHSRSASVAETDEIFHKHDVPPMPMRSDVQSSDLTRDSILSERTEEPLTPREGVRMAELQHVSRGSPREVLTSGAGTPTRSPHVQKRLGTHHSNNSQGDLSPRSARSERDLKEEHHSKAADVGMMGAAAGADALAARELSNRHDAHDDYDYGHRNRGLSPIQSVSSRQDSEGGSRDSFRRQYSSDSITAIKEQNREMSGTSLKSASSAADIQFDHSNRPRKMNFEPAEVVLDQHRLRDSEYMEGDYSEKDEKDAVMEEWLQQEHEKNDRYRDSMGEDSMRDSTVDYNRMTNYTDDSMDAPHLDRVTAAQELQGGGAGRNPDYRSTPVAVESAVASLVDTSTISARSKVEETGYPDAHEAEHMRNSVDVDAMSRDIGSKERLLGHVPGEHLEKRISERSLPQSHRSTKDSPRQSVTRSVDESPIPMGASGLPVAEDPMPEIGHGLNSESEISTNPSIIQGPMGGPQTENRDHWPYQATPTQPKTNFVTRSKDSSAHESLKAAAAGFLGAAGTAALANKNGQHYRQKDSPSRSRELSMKDGYQPGLENEYGVNHDFGPTDRDSYLTNPPIPSPPKDYRDEGYVSGPQRAIESPRGKSFNDAKNWDDGGSGLDGLDLAEDPFVGKTNHTRHLSTNSGLAGGMGSPLYDSATGEGLDRIPSKDIVALMDHVSTAIPL